MVANERRSEALEQYEVLEAYEALSAKFDVILRHAEDGEWDAVIEQNAAYLAEWEHLRFLEAHLGVDADSSVRKIALMREILEQGAEVRRRLVAQRDRLGQMILEASDRRAAADSYNAVERLRPDPEGVLT